MECAQYLRVSTTEQSYENQLPDLEALARARGFEILSTYAKKVSALKQRPAFEKMLADAHRGKFQVVLVGSLDRLHWSTVGVMCEDKVENQGTARQRRHNDRRRDEPPASTNRDGGVVGRRGRLGGLQVGVVGAANTEQTLFSSPEISGCRRSNPVSPEPVCSVSNPRSTEGV